MFNGKSYNQYENERLTPPKDHWTQDQEYYGELKDEEIDRYEHFAEMQEAVLWNL